MFTAKKINKPIALIVLLLPLAILIALSAGNIISSLQGSADAVFSVKNPEDMVGFLKSYGWKTDISPAEVCETVIPKSFDRVFKNYNELQLTQGFDLTKFAGRTVTRYSFNVKNYPDTDESVRANLLVCDGEIIGGDICTLRPDGFMHGLKMTGTGNTEQTMIYQ